MQLYPFLKYHFAQFLFLWYEFQKLLPILYTNSDPQDNYKFSNLIKFKFGTVSYAFPKPHSYLKSPHQQCVNNKIQDSTSIPSTNTKICAIFFVLFWPWFQISDFQHFLSAKYSTTSKFRISRTIRSPNSECGTIKYFSYNFSKHFYNHLFISTLPAGSDFYFNILKFQLHPFIQNQSKVLHAFTWESNWLASRIAWKVGIFWEGGVWSCTEKIYKHRNITTVWQKVKECPTKEGQNSISNYFYSHLNTKKHAHSYFSVPRKSYSASNLSKFH